MNHLQEEILRVMNNCNAPLVTVYSVCDRLHERQQRSNQKFYRRVYRNMEILVDKKYLWVMRGTRDPSVYLSVQVVKGHGKNLLGEIPF